VIPSKPTAGSGIPATIRPLPCFGARRRGPARPASGRPQQAAGEAAWQPPALGIVLSDHTADDGALVFQQAAAWASSLRMIPGLKPRGHRLEAIECALPVRALAGLDQGPEQPGDGATSRSAGNAVAPVNYGWRPIETAPLDEDIALQVTDGRGGPYNPRWPCRNMVAGRFKKTAVGDVGKFIPMVATSLPRCAGCSTTSPRRSGFPGSGTANPQAGCECRRIAVRRDGDRRRRGSFMMMRF
jgi:hypothetical protein